MRKMYRTFPALFPGLLLLSLLFLPLQKALATHAMGADITYSCVAPNQYQVSLTFFRDCVGILPPSTEILTYSSVTCGVSSSITLTLTGTVVDVTPLCPGGVSSCSGGGGQYGIEQYVYRGMLNLPAGCGTDWVLGWDQCCRNFAITTLSAPGNQDMYVSAQLNNTLAPCNNSPIYTNIPTPFVCINQPVIYNHGITDPDGDDLVFSLVQCEQSGALPVAYSGAFNATVPLSTSTGVNVNPSTGELTFTPNAIQIGVLCIQVEEYRNGVKIGETVRDMQFNVIGCSNQPPVASGVNGTSSYSLTVCAGTNACFNVNMTDANADDILASWNGGIPGATLSFANNNTTTPTATFCWPTTVNDIGSQFFTISVEDDNCPLTGSSTYTYEIIVTNAGPPVNAGPDQSICAGGTASLNATAGATSYSWTPATGLSNPNIQNPTASPTNTTVYTVTATWPDGCTSSDFVTVAIGGDPNLSISPGVAYICPGSNITLTANAPTATGYLWSNAATTNSITVSPTTTTTYTLTITDAAGCDNTESITVNVNTSSANSCNVVYASPTGTPAGSGTQADPTNLATAISMANCSDMIIKLATGTFTLDNPLTSISGNITLEGGFDAANNWRKTSTPGATTIHRSALNPEGAANQQRLVAIYLSNANNFRFQDITITTAAANQPGMSTYGVHMTNCSNYQFVRTQVLPGAAAAGAAGTAGIDGIDGANGGNGLNGYAATQADPGHGGNGGAGGGINSGTGGAGAVDINGTGCCAAGLNGSNGTASTDPRSGGGGGGGGSGGEAANFGGNGGNGGGVNGGPAQTPGGAGGINGDASYIADDGGPGVAGQAGATGTNPGTIGPAGTHNVGFWLPGGPGGI
jgi:hypothetical protein